MEKALRKLRPGVMPGMHGLWLCITFSLIVAACGKRDAECVERIDPDCVCTMEYHPVCGCNGKTYPNACTAECHGITRFTPGPCEKS